MTFKQENFRDQHTYQAEHGKAEQAKASHAKQQNKYAEHGKYAHNEKPARQHKNEEHGKHGSSCEGIMHDKSCKCNESCKDSSCSNRRCTCE